jgi:glycerophosphoryl diester phosphodiesterase
MTITPADRSRPLVVAHRGASAEAPEHTLAAYEAAVAQQADMIELDVHLSADDQLVVIHDERLERTTDGRGLVREHSLQALKRLDAGGWFAPAFRGQRIQTLTELLERFRDRVRFAIELKSGSDFAPGIEERLVSILQIYDMTARVLVLSFDHHALRKVHQMDPDIRTGALFVGRLLNPGALSDPAVNALCLQAEVTTERDVEGCLRSGLQCFVWVVNEAEAARRYARAGVTGLITDRPGLLRRALEHIGREAY